MFVFCFPKTICDSAREVFLPDRSLVVHQAHLTFPSHSRLGRTKTKDTENNFSQFDRELRDLLLFISRRL